MLRSLYRPRRRMDRFYIIPYDRFIIKRHHRNWDQFVRSRPTLHQLLHTNIYFRPFFAFISYVLLHFIVHSSTFTFLSFSHSIFIFLSFNCFPLFISSLPFALVSFYLSNITLKVVRKSINSEPEEVSEIRLLCVGSHFSTVSTVELHEARHDTM
jgi:hypothetical protein